MVSATSIIAWGSGEDGQLGIGTYEEKEWACVVESLEPYSVRSVVSGSRNSLAICDDGTMFTWGWNQRGTLGHPPETKTENIPSRVKTLANVKITQAAIGGWHCLAVDDHGRAYAWGGNEYGQCGEDGRLLAWGNNEYGQLGTGDTQPSSHPVPVLGLHDLTLVDIAAGGWHSTALTEKGEVYGWGRGEHGRLGFGDNDKSSKMVPQKVHLLAEEDIIQVSCGGTHSVALTIDGRIFSFGRGDHGRLGYGRKVTTGQPLELPLKIPPPEGSFNHADEEEEGKWLAKSIACGGRHTLAIVEWKSDDI